MGKLVLKKIITTIEEEGKDRDRNRYSYLFRQLLVGPFARLNSITKLEILMTASRINLRGKEGRWEARRITITQIVHSFIHPSIHPSIHPES